MKLPDKQNLATLGLIFITILSAFQYSFLRNVPETVSTFAFVCVTNGIGVLILGVVQPKKLFTIKKTTLKKGVFFAIELLGFNVFLLLGSRHLDAVVTSSLVSMYFVFVTPMLLLARKKVSFFSGIATVIAIISLLLLFGADVDALFTSGDVFYLLVADLCFAAYVVSVSLFGESEDATQLTLSQMLFSGIFALAGWGFECLIFNRHFTLPTEWDFWISALFIGIFIRVLYGLVQISSQKYVSALKASLIFSSEIIITLLSNPILCRLLHTQYTPPTLFQVCGGALLIFATLMVDDTVMEKVGYEGLREVSYVNASGEMMKRVSVAKKVIMTTLTFSMLTLILSAVTFLSAIHFIRADAVESSQELGRNASSLSAEALKQKLEDSIREQVTDKALLAEQKLSAYSKAVTYAASFAHSLYMNPNSYPDREVERTLRENAGRWVMQRALASRDIDYSTLRSESSLLGNMEDVFVPFVNNIENIATVYMGTESGLLISYDPYSDSGDDIGEVYYEYFNTDWYLQGKNTGVVSFTPAYQDSYGRGLTITCVAPFTDASGNFAGCIAMDILVSELNASMVNDGIVNPSVAVLIDREGNYIAGKNVDPLSENMGSILDDREEVSLRLAGAEILEKKEGIIRIGKDEDADYIAFATIDSTQWTLCIKSPVSAVIAPAVAIRADIDQNTENVVTAVMQGIMTVIQSCLLFTALILIFVTLFAGRISKKISDPLRQLEADVRQISAGNLENRTQVDTDDEIGSLANSFNQMTDSLQKYIADLKEVTAKEQRVVGELSAASNIQASMLPRSFPERSEFSLYASMTPAKEVGGDFYDFFMVDKDHLAVVIADVSGKGVPAALFMVIAKTLIKNHTQAGKPADEAFRDANNQLCDGNSNAMFVTAWLGILDIPTGLLSFTDAGHENPIILRASGEVELLKQKNKMPPLAIMEGMPYTASQVKLGEGDTLFLYTDGVPEATNADSTLYDMERLEALMRQHTKDEPQELLTAVREDVDRFVGSAPQFDDLTMLGLKIRRIKGADSGNDEAGDAH